MDRKLQVFVSSTFTDLIDERQAAVTAILKSGHMPAGMELFTAGNKSQWNTITRWIDESDVYMLILGGRYGSIEPASGLSYTELEYDYAVGKNKPLFAIVASDTQLEAKFKVQGLTASEQDNPQLLKAFRKKVLSNISRFFDDEKDIRLGVMESLMHLSELNETSGWVRASSIVDTRSLDEALVRLTKDNEALQSKIKTLEAGVSTIDKSTDEKEILQVLEETKILTNETYKAQLGQTISVLKACDLFTDLLVGGVTSLYGANSASTWLYNSVMPKLILHGLAVEDKGRRKLNAFGTAVFARRKREKVLLTGDHKSP